MQVEAFSVVVKLRIILANVCLKLYRPLSGGRAVHVQAAAVASGGVYSTGAWAGGGDISWPDNNIRAAESDARVTLVTLVTGGHNNADIY